jgi:hypothetical protein
MVFRKKSLLNMVDRQLQLLSADQYIYSYEEIEAQQVQPQNQTSKRFEQRKIIEEQVQITKNL